MNLGVAQSMALLIIGVIMVVILVAILVAVHSQVRRVKELEMRMKAMEKMEVEESPTDKKTEK